MKAEDLKIGDRLDHFGQIWTVVKIKRRRANVRTGAPEAITEILLQDQYRDSFGKIIEGRFDAIHPRDLSSFKYAAPDRYHSRDVRRPRRDHAQDREKAKKEAWNNRFADEAHSLGAPSHVDWGKANRLRLKGTSPEQAARALYRNAQRDPRSALELRRLAFKAKRSPEAREVLRDALIETGSVYNPDHGTQRNVNELLEETAALAKRTHLPYEAIYLPPTYQRTKGSIIIRQQHYFNAAGLTNVYPNKVVIYTAFPPGWKARASKPKRSSRDSSHRSYGGVRMCPCTDQPHPRMITYDPEDPHFGRDRLRKRSRFGTRTRSSRDRLTTRKRRALRTSQFALPRRRALPIENGFHARNAAARLEQMRKRGTVTPAEYRSAYRRIKQAERRFSKGR